MSFDIERFVTHLSKTELYALTKPQLRQVIGKLEIHCEISAKKIELRQLLLDHFVEEDLIPEEQLSDSGNSDVEIKRLELELRAREQERDHECQLKLKELELKEKELAVREREMQLQLKLKELEVQKAAPPASTEPPPPAAFDVSRQVRLVPPFQEQEVDKFFLHFKKVAANLHWPNEARTMLLQSVLVGKAREVYSSLSVEQSADYEVVKREILKAYELVPEAYRQRFQEMKCKEGQTYMEFARQKEALFNRWCTSQQIDHSFEKLKQLVLLEEFKSCVPVNIKTYLEEQKVVELHRAATLADDYKLTHLTLSSVSVPPRAKGSFNSAHSDNQSREQEQLGQKRGMVLRSGPTCAYCKRKGHLISECWALEKKENSKQKVNSVMVMNAAGENPSSGINKSSFKEIQNVYKPFMSEGFVSLHEHDVISKPIKILRDTGASTSLLVEGVLPLSGQSATGDHVLIHGVELGFIRVPLHKVFLQSDLVSGSVIVGVCPTLPVEGVNLLLGNDLAGDKVMANPCVSSFPGNSENTEKIMEDIPGLFPVCAVTRAMAKRAESQAISVPSSQAMSSLGDSNELQTSKMSLTRQDTKKDNDLNDDCEKQDCLPSEIVGAKSVPTRRLIDEQESNPELVSLRQGALCEYEAAKVSTCFYIKNGVLMRKWRPPTASPTDEWQVSHQIVVPKPYRRDVLNLAHESPLAGHLGINKTYNRVLAHFYWPGLRSDVVKLCKSCHVCQMVGKPNQKPPSAPLKPIPAVGEPFSRVLIDCVGPLPKTKSGNQFLLTIMCMSTRFPEAVPLRNIKAHTILKALIKFFTFVGLPKFIQSDQGSNFMSEIFQQMMHQLNITQYKSAAYHPQSQGAIERFHQTLKNMMRSYCFEFEKDWDEGIHLLLFAAREAVQEALGFSPFELVFGHVVRGPLKMLKETWLSEEETFMDLLKYVSTFRYRLSRASELARENLKQSQSKMKVWYDQKARDRKFSVGDKVLVLLPITGHTLQARYHGPYVVTQKVSDVDYIIATPDRRKQHQLCHVSMLKRYHDGASIHEQSAIALPVCSFTSGEGSDELKSGSDDSDHVGDVGMQLNNSQVLKDLSSKLQHLAESERVELEKLLLENVAIFPDVPSRTIVLYHDVDVGESQPEKQHAYRVNPQKRNTCL